jgi:hypothetical protein
MNDKFASYPFVVVRIACEACARSGSYRLARLAAKYGAEIAMPDLLKQLTLDCRFNNPRHPYQGRCRARFSDLEPPMRPPDLPKPMRLRIVRST